MADLTPAALRAEITTGPLAASLASAWADGRDNDVAALLNLPREDGYVPARHAVADMNRFGKWGMVPLAVLHRKLPNDADCPVQLYYLFSTMHLAAYGTIDPALRLEVGPLRSAIKQVVGLGLLSEEEGDSVLAGEVKLSRIEIITGKFGVAISANDVADARKAGG